MTPDPKSEDARLQPDPELQMSGGRASLGQIVVTMIGAFAIVVLVLYGLTHQRDESERTTAAAPASETAGAAPPANRQDAAKQQAHQGQPNADAKQGQPNQ